MMSRAIPLVSSALTPVTIGAISPASGLAGRRSRSRRSRRCTTPAVSGALGRHAERQGSSAPTAVAPRLSYPLSSRSSDARFGAARLSGSGSVSTDTVVHSRPLPFCIPSSELSGQNANCLNSAPEPLLRRCGALFAHGREDGSPASLSLRVVER